MEPNVDEEDQTVSEDTISGSDGQFPQPPTLVAATVIGSLPVLEASTQVERDRDDEAFTQSRYTPRFRPMTEEEKEVLDWIIRQKLRNPFRIPNRPSPCMTIKEGRRERHHEGRIRWKAARHNGLRTLECGRLCENEEVLCDESEGQFPLHPDFVSATVIGSPLTLETNAQTAGDGDDDKLVNPIRVPSRETPEFSTDEIT
jgi:hypothetical protein